MASDCFGLTLDTGHECKLKYSDSHIYEKYPEKIIHLHLHDCDNSGPHIPLGTGDVNINEKLSSLKGETCLIEVKTIDGLKESVKYLRNKEK